MKKIIATLAILASLSLPVKAAPLGNPIVSVQTNAAAASMTVTPTYKLLNGFSATAGAVSGYVLIFDATTVPANGTVTPKFCYSLPANQTTGASWISYPVPFATGIVFAFSSTGCFTKTASTTAFFSAQVQ